MVVANGRNAQGPHYQPILFEVEVINSFQSRHMGAQQRNQIQDMPREVAQISSLSPPQHPSPRTS
jgi:hypothetical protein